MGLTLGPVNQVTQEGLPVLFIKDLPPASSVSLRVTRPELYFGELTDSWVFARTHQREFDYPSGDENIFTSYAGTGGVRVGSFLRRLVFATYFRSLKVLLSSDITSDSRAMYVRNIRLRASTALPFLLFDGDAYLVVADSGLFRVQTDLYATYHMAEPDVFYHREDQWQKPVLSRPGERPDPFLRHMVMRLPEERQAEFILMVPFTPRGKDNLASWMVARNDGEHYGRLVLYRFPKQSLVYGPTQIVNRINQDPDISRQISLWDQHGSEVIRGNLLVIPIEESLIYVQPLYLRAQGGGIPELKRVVVTYQNQVVMEETLEAGLARLFGGAVEPATAAAAPPGAARPGNGRAADLARRAAELYQGAVEAQRSGDWARYGEALSRLGEVLRQLQTVLGGRQP